MAENSIPMEQAAKKEAKDVEQPLAIFVIGKTGVGKSTLINSLLGEKKAKVSHGLDPTDHDTIEKHEGSFCSVPTVFYDTRGINNLHNDEGLIKTLKHEIKGHGDQFIVFICQQFQDKLDENFVKFLARKIGNDYVWLSTILVLTQANNYDPEEDNDSDDDVNEEDEDCNKESVKDDTTEFQKQQIIEERGQIFKSTLEKYGLSKEVIQNMPVCVAGNKSTTSLLVADNWMDILMEKCKLCQENRHKFNKRMTYEWYGTVAGSAIGAALGLIVPPLIPLAAGTIGPIAGQTLARLIYEDKAKKEESDKHHEKGDN